VKKLLSLVALAFFTAAVQTALADDVAVLSIRSGDKIQRVVIEFYQDSAPITVANFKKLAKSRFYNGTAVHRVFPHLMIQAGDPLSKRKGNGGIGTGGPGYTLPPEFGRKHIVGAVAAARLPDKINPARVSNGSQFYVTLRPMPNLDGQYTVFGHVVEGMDVLDKISTALADTNDKPVAPVIIDSMHIMPRAAVLGGPVGERPKRHFQGFF